MPLKNQPRKEMVKESDWNQQRAWLKIKDIRRRGSACNCTIIKAICGKKQEKKRNALSISYVNAEFYINRAGKNLPEKQQQTLEKQKTN